MGLEQVSTKRSINPMLLSQFNLKRAIDILGTYHDMASVLNLVYWPGLGISCLDPALLDVEDDVASGNARKSTLRVALEL